MAAVKKHGTKWSVIVKDLPGRSDNAIKNRYYSAVRKAFRQERRDQTVEAAEASPGKAEGGRSYDDSAHVEAARVGIELRHMGSANAAEGAPAAPAAGRASRPPAKNAPKRRKRRGDTPEGMPGAVVQRFDGDDHMLVAVAPMEAFGSRASGSGDGRVVTSEGMSPSNMQQMAAMMPGMVVPMHPASVAAAQAAGMMLGHQMAIAQAQVPRSRRDRAGARPRDGACASPIRFTALPAGGGR